MKYKMTTVFVLHILTQTGERGMKENNTVTLVLNGHPGDEKSVAA
jgi:hypothetical protein